MKTNKINVVLSLNKTVVSNYGWGNGNITKVSGTACAATVTNKTTENVTKTTVTVSPTTGKCDIDLPDCISTSIIWCVP